MTASSAADPLVSLVVVPRERFSCARESLQSVYEQTETPFHLIYVDGGSPAEVRAFLEKEARERSFELIRTDHYLSPNHARNLGLRRVTTRYVVFLDNDVVVTPGWLASLVDCAEATGAAIVGPLTCQGTPAHEVIHCAGGRAEVTEAVVEGRVTRQLTETIRAQGRRVAALRSELRRGPTGVAEFHCMLVRTDFLTEIGGLDEGFMNSKEHVDLCLLAAARGATIYLEPASVVTYMPATDLHWRDVPFYMLRWSDAWERASLARLQTKWQLAGDPYFAKRYANVGWRRRMMIIRPLVARLPLPRGRSRIERFVSRIERVLNNYLTARHSRRVGHTLSPRASH